MKLIVSTFIFLNIFGASGQKKFIPHVVYDKNHNEYAVKVAPTLFLKLIDSIGKYSARYPSAWTEYLTRGECSVKKVHLGKETSFDSREKAQALLDYWKQINFMHSYKVKTNQYSD